MKKIVKKILSKIEKIRELGWGGAPQRGVGGGDRPEPSPEALVPTQIVQIVPRIVQIVPPKI